MKYTQNEKILQVTERTLVVGVDIAKERHVGRAFETCQEFCVSIS
ncbi:hypothetical protein Csac_0841 [Caldicellulosiruptor saccharolyticus DSM 8903]|uniref:Uncharacterized protein n=1 Tax=Caldicellulosiruptor saccharolyticus (strain ATCC 43494 / DSM 8903 / Tp8T 6331) TaxID=351627 RepID=A4XHS4_CALS8|nr:hypothetical protein [Caldicellulosiruptor saccharolyticus]ABP66459.2 hypothetical protein Csac_0841 [Caldicellulosiruptor saccharolyticus DSM 8903]